jgi:hypothetical protein
MKKILWVTLLSVLGLNGWAQSSNNTLLWKISGKNLAKPSYLFGTIHMLCSKDIELSDSLKVAIHNADRVYLELDMDNILEMMGALRHMKMRNDTTLADLLTGEEYQKVKKYFNAKGGLLPFSMIETYKPMLAATTLMEGSMGCDDPVAMEQLIMKEAKKSSREIKGLETVGYQLSIFDSIPYKLQAKQLLKIVEDADKDKEASEQELKQLTDAYRNQELKKLETLTQKEQEGLPNFNNLLLYNRNSNWVRKLEELMPKGSLVIAVGAGHLPGDKGVINLLRKAGYKVEPVKNEMIRKRTKEI